MVKNCLVCPFKLKRCKGHRSKHVWKYFEGKTMYHAVEMIAVERGINKRWQTVGLLTYTVKELFVKFRKVWVTLQMQSESTNIYLDLEKVAATYGDFSGRIGDLLIDVGNGVLPTINERPAINIQYVKYADAYRAGYRVELSNRFFKDNPHPDELTDAVVTRTDPETDYAHFKKHCLTTVNGFIHMCDTDNMSGVYVIDAGKTLKKSEKNHLGLISFEDMCEIQTIPITPEMLKIAPGDASRAFKDAGYIHIEEDLAGKTPVLVLGGYLILPDSGYLRRHSDHDISIDFSTYPLMDRLLESMSYLDLSGLALPVGGNNSTQLSVEYVYSDEMLKKYLQMSCSFVVLLDTPEVYVQRHQLRHFNHSAWFYYHKKPVMPMVTQTGRMPEYLSTLEDDMYVLAVDDAVEHRRVYRTTNGLELTSICGSDRSVESVVPSAGYLLEIGTDMAK